MSERFNSGSKPKSGIDSSGSGQPNDRGGWRFAEGIELSTGEPPSVWLIHDGMDHGGPDEWLGGIETDVQVAIRGFEIGSEEE